MSEDPAADGANWYIYANASATNVVDASGCAAKPQWNWYVAGAGLAVAALSISGSMAADRINVLGAQGSVINLGLFRMGNRYPVARLLAAAAVAAFAIAVNETGQAGGELGKWLFSYVPAALGLYGGVLACMIGSLNVHSAVRMSRQASGYSYAVMVYGMMCLGVLVSMEFD